jgi:hypothetical protein
MKSSTKTVGGNPTSGLGQDFNSFLQQGLTTGNFGANANAQTNGVGGAINSLLGGQIGDPTTLQGFLQGLQGNGGLGNLPNVSGNFNAPQFQGLDFSQLGQIGGNAPNILQGQGQAGLGLGGLSLPNFNSAQFQNPLLGANLNQNVGAANLPGVQFNPAQFQNTRLQYDPTSQGQNFSQFLNPSASAGLDPNGSFSQALQQIQQNQLNQGVADVRERYTGQSGTPAGFAEAALRAQMAPQLTAALSQANQTERGLNLQQQGLNQGNTQAILGLQNQAGGLQSNAINQANQLRLQQGLAGNQFNQQNSQLGLNAQGINTGNILQNQALQNQGMLGLNSNVLQQMGLSNDAINQLNQLNLSQAQGQNQFGLQGAGLQQQQQLGLNQNLLSQLGLSNDALNAFNQSNLASGQLNQNAQTQNVQNQLAQMQQMLQQNQFGNTFGQQNAQFGANFGQQSQQMNAQNMLQNQSLMNQFGLGQAGIGIQNQGQQLQAILGALGPLFGGLQQATGLATPQAQTVQKPSMFSQLTGGIGNLLGGIGSFATGIGGLGSLGSLFGGGNQVAGPYQNAGQMVGASPLNVQQYQMPLVNQQQYPWIR